MSSQRTNKHNNTQHTRNNTIMTIQLPDANNVSLFKMTDEQLFSFNRRFRTPNDCVINALQLIGMVDDFTGNLLRITMTGQIGSTSTQIELIFILKFKYNFHFTKIGNIHTFSDYLIQYVPPGHVVFAGYSGHVFLAGKDISGRPLYIDPQIVNTPICYLDIKGCSSLINGNPPWYLLMHSNRVLTDSELNNIGFIV